MKGLRWAIAAIVAAACTVPDVSMTVDLPAAVQPQTAWIEIGAFPSACPAATSLAGGLPPSGLAARIAYAADASALGLGKIDTGIYGFAAIARRDDCGVIAAGCSVADISSARSLDVSLDATGDPDASACTNGLVCSNARCIPPTTDDPNAGAGCSMVFMGAGPLPDAVLGGPLVTAPAIIPNPAGGFLIGYAEYLSTDGSERLTLQPIDDGGGAGAPMQQAVSGECMNLTKMGATGLVLTGAGGLVVLPHPGCMAMNQSGFDVFGIDSMGNLGMQNPVLPGTSPIGMVTHSLTSAASNGKFLLAATEPAAQLFTANATGVTSLVTGFGTAQDTAARVVRTTGVIAVVVDGPSVGDAGISGSVARVYLTSGGADPMSLGNPVDQTPASITALTALGTRAFLVMNGGGMGEDVAMQGYDLGGKTAPAVTAGFGAPKTGSLLSLDAAAAQNRVLCAFEQQDSVSIGIIDQASTPSPQILGRIDLAGDIRIPQSFHDGPIAVAATNSRVAVTWIAHKDALADGDTLGGYAVFACRP